MKRLRLLILLPLVVLLSGSVTTSHLQVLARKNVAGGCATEHVSNIGSATDSKFVGWTSDNYKSGQRSWDPGSNVSVCAVEFYITSSGTVSGWTYHAEIWTDDGSGSLSVQQGADSAGVTGDNAWSNSAVKFEWASSVSVTSGTDYCILITRDGLEGSSNYIKIDCTAAGGADGYWARWDSDGAMDNWDTVDIKTVIYVE